MTEYPAAPPDPPLGSGDPGATGAEASGAPAADASHPVPHASAADLATASELEQSLVSERRVDVVALLVATALLRIGSVGAGLSVGFELSRNGVDPRVTGIVGSINLISELVLAPVLARYADRLGRTRFLIGGPLVGALGLILLTLARHPVQMGGARLFEGIAAAAFVPTALGTIAAATSHNSKARAGASGAFEGANLVGYALGLLLAGTVHPLLRGNAYLVFGLFYLAAAVVCARWIPRVPPLPVSPLGVVLRAVTGRGPIRTFLPAWMASFAIIGGFLVNMPPLLRSGPGAHAVPGQSLAHQLSEPTVAAVLFGGLVVLVLGIVLWTPLLTRWGAAVTMRRAVPGAWVMSVGLLALNHFPLSYGVAIAPTVVVGIVILAGFGPAAVTYLAECSETFAADRSALMAFYTLTLAAGGLVGGVAGGFASRWGGINGVAFLALGLSAFAFVALGRVVRYEAAMVSAVPGAS